MLAAGKAAQKQQAGNRVGRTRTSDAWTGNEGLSVGSSEATKTPEG